MDRKTYECLEKYVQDEMRSINDEPEMTEGLRSSKIANVVKVADKLLQSDEISAKKADSKRREVIERNRNKAMIKSEEIRQKMEWKKVAIEVAKVAVPVATTMITVSVWKEGFMNMLTFEKDGFVKSFTSRQIGFPRILK